MKHVIDAQNKKIGRVASEAAVFLMGKNRTDFERRTAPDVIVEIQNVAHLDISERKAEGKEYIRHSEYRGSQKREVLRHYVARKGHAAVLRRAVEGMLPKNKLRPIMMKHLIINE